MSFKDRMKDAADQAAVKARKAAEQARELAAEVKAQAEEKWAEEQNRRQGPQVPPSAGTPMSGETVTEAGHSVDTPPSATDATQPATPSPAGLGEGLKAAAARASQLRDSAANGNLGASLGRLKPEIKRKKPKLPGFNRQQLLALCGLVGIIVVVLAIVGITSFLGADTDPAPTAAAAKPTPAESVEPTPEPTPTTAVPEAPVTDISVDALLDMLNNESIDGPAPSDPKTGDRFRISGPLFEERMWGVGASGDYSVLFKAQGGKQDLMVFVDQADAENWTDDTEVEMLVELVEVTVNGEKSNGWLRAISTKTLSKGTTPEKKAAGSEKKMLKDADSVRKSFNSLAQFEAFLRVGPGASDGVVYVYLDPSFLTQDIDLAQQFINQFNKALVESLGDNAAFHNMVKYFIGDQLVGANKEFLDPYSVDFQGGLEK